MTGGWFVIYDAITKIILLTTVVFLSVYILRYLKKEVKKQKKEVGYLRDYTMDLKDLYYTINSEDKKLLKFKDKLIKQIEAEEISKSEAFGLLLSRTNANLEYRLNEIFEYLALDNLDDDYEC